MTKKKDKKVLGEVSFVWKRTYYKDKSIVTSRDWKGRRLKLDMMDCIEDLMEEGGLLSLIY